MERLREVLDRLRALQRELLTPTEDPLAEKLGRRRQFGAVDDSFAKKGTFKTAGEQHADAISAAVEARVERTLATLQAKTDEQSRVGTTRPIRHREELKELVTKKVK